MGGARRDDQHAGRGARRAAWASASRAAALLTAVAATAGPAAAEPALVLSDPDRVDLPHIARSLEPFLGGANPGPALLALHPDDNRGSVVAFDGVRTDAAVARLFPAGSGATDLTPIRLAGDGATDLASAAPGAGRPILLRNRGDDRFAMELGPVLGGEPASIAAGDLDGDGIDDLLLADRATNRVTLLTLAPDGAVAQLSSLPTGARPVAIVAADFNGDGIADFATADQLADAVTLYLSGDGGTGGAPGAGGGWGLRAELPVGSRPSAIVAADIDLDRDLDLIVTNSNAGSIKILLGDPSGTFTMGPTLPAGGSPTAAAVADVDGDFAPDILVAGRSDRTVRVHLWRGAGGSPSVTAADWSSEVISLATDASAVAAVELDGSGAPEIVVADADAPRLWVYRNLTEPDMGECPGDTNGDLYVDITDFIALASNFGSRTPRAAASGDFNGDGSVDIADFMVLATSFGAVCGET